MIRIINGPVERIIVPEDLKKWTQAGFKPVDPLPDLPVSEIQEIPALDPEPEQKSETASSEEIPENLNQMKSADLRKIAKKIGVQGYQNMDKATLIAVIQAH